MHHAVLTRQRTVRQLKLKVLTHIKTRLVFVCVRTSAPTRRCWRLGRPVTPAASACWSPVHQDTNRPPGPPLKTASEFEHPAAENSCLVRPETCIEGLSVSLCSYVRYFIRTASMKLGINGCSFKCYREVEVKSCCPGYWGPDCIGEDTKTLMSLKYKGFLLRSRNEMDQIYIHQPVGFRSEFCHAEAQSRDTFSCIFNHFKYPV